MSNRSLVLFVVAVVVILLASPAVFAQKGKGKAAGRIRPEGAGAPTPGAGAAAPAAPAGAAAPTVTPSLGAPALPSAVPAGTPGAPAVQPEITRTGFNFTAWLVIVGGLIAAGLILRRYGVCLKER